MTDFIMRKSVGQDVWLTAHGAWTVDQAHQLHLAASAATLTGNPAAAIEVIDAHDIGHLDTYGACILEQLRLTASTHGRELRVVGLPQRCQQLYDQVSRIAAETEPSIPGGPKRPNPISRIGVAVENAVDDLARFAEMLGRIVAGLIELLRKPRSFRLTSTVHQLDRVGWQAVPIIALITFLIGAIIAQQGFFHFRKFGADEYVVDMVGILILREIGVLIVAIMVAGRSGSAYTAELGSMKMREEIDALRTMGLDPVEVLVLPRVLALTLALPMLTFLGSMSALYGGGLTAWLYGGMSPDIFLARLKDAISIAHFKVGMIKAPFMALVIGTVACAEGFAVKGSAESLGRQTTASVVKSIFLVIVLDGLFAIFFAAIGL